MNLKRLMGAAAVAFTCTFVGEIKADLFLTGDVVGKFRGDAGANTGSENSADGNAAFRTGVAIAGSFRSGVSFVGTSFTGVGEGETVSLGSLSYYNGITEIGTSSHSAVLDLYLRLTDPSKDWVHLSTLNFIIDATLNAKGRPVADYFLASYTPEENATIGGENLDVSITGLPATTSVKENSKVDVGDLILTVGPSVLVSEQESSFLLLVLGLGIIAIRRQTAGWSYL